MNFTEISSSQISYSKLNKIYIKNVLKNPLIYVTSFVYQSVYNK